MGTVRPEVHCTASPILLNQRDVSCAANIDTPPANTLYLKSVMVSDQIPTTHPDRAHFHLPSAPNARPTLGRYLRERDKIDMLRRLPDFVPSATLSTRRLLLPGLRAEPISDVISKRERMKHHQHVYSQPVASPRLNLLLLDNLPPGGGSLRA
jgi:hypothetical protein